MIELPFAACWFLYYSEQIYKKVGWKGNLTILALFFILYIVIGRIYDAFSMSNQRVSEMVYGQILGAMATDGIMYIVICLMSGKVCNLWPGIAAIAGQLIMATAWAMLANKWYYMAFPPQKTAIVYDVRQGMEKLISEYGLDKKYDVQDGSFAKKLYSLYLTYLPTEKFKYALKMNVDNRGSFTELVHTADCGQVSINISKPGITKGQHWHNSKWELFIVVAGHGLIQERNINTGETVEFEVSGDKIEAVHMIPGWTHNIINLSETENLVTVMTCNEIFDPNHPDTFFEPV